MRKTKEITITENGNSMTFLLTQMPATRLERFLLRLVVLLGGAVDSNVDFSKLQKIFAEKPENAISTIFANIKGLDFDTAYSLIDSLYPCAQQKAGGALIQVTKDNVDSMLGEISSLITLQKEILALNFDFFTKGAQSTGAQEQKNQANTFNMRISPQT